MSLAAAKVMAALHSGLITDSSCGIFVFFEDLCTQLVDLNSPVCQLAEGAGHLQLLRG
jgi:hypothetical protein